MAYPQATQHTRCGPTLATDKGNEGTCMDAAEIEETAQRLRLLGCTAEQIDAHVKSLRSIATKQLKQIEPTPPKSQRPPIQLARIRSMRFSLSSKRGSGSGATPIQHQRKTLLSGQVLPSLKCSVAATRCRKTR